MLIIGIMCVGIIIGHFVFPQKLKNKNEALQMICTLLLIFSMGVMLGKRENFFSDLTRLGFQSFLFFIIPTGLSLFLTYFLTEQFMKKGEVKESKKVNGEKKDTNEKQAGEWWMAGAALTALISGIIYGVSGMENFLITLVCSNTDVILDLLMFSVGISIGLKEGIIQNIRTYHFKILMIPLAVVTASAAGGVICALITGYPLRQGASVAGGLGWYSLAGITIGNLAGEQLGSIAFLSNLLRELFSFFSIPFLSKRFNYFSCIAVAGATSEDTTLPMMIKYTDEETVLLSVLNGVICSALVPFLIAVCY